MRMGANEDSKSAWEGYRWREKMANAGYVVLAVTSLLVLFALSVGKHIHVAFFLGAALTFPMAMCRLWFGENPLSAAHKSLLVSGHG